MGPGRLGGLGGGSPSAELLMRLRGMRVGSEVPNRKTGFWLGFLDSVEQEKGGSRGGGGLGDMEWSRKGGRREGGREWGRGGWVEWEGGQARRFWWVNCPKQKRGSFWLVFLDRVEQEGTGAGGGGVGLGRGWVEWEGGPKHGPFAGTWWECASILNCPKQKNGSFWLGSWTGWSRKGGGSGERGGRREWGPGRLGGLGGGSQARSF